MIPLRKVGRTNLEVPVICLGGNVFGWTVDEPTTFRLLDRAADLGLTFIDTADVYSRWVPGHQGGESETLIGKWLARGHKRESVIIATKVGMALEKGGLAAGYIQQQAEASLKRLQTDYIDIYFSHKDDPATPLEETLAAYAKLIDQGKVRIIGASNYKGARLREALETSQRNSLPAYSILQPHYNLLERADYESDLAPVVKEFGLGVVPYYALASGFLTGKYKTAEDAKGKARGGAVGKYLNDRGFAILRAVEEVARAANSTPARVALAWLIAQPGITAPIASATNLDQLEDLAEAAKLNLDDASLAKLNKAKATA
jgi:aryl-alcohol dehydrogenase-like predicted oxidoreductase